MRTDYAGAEQHEILENGDVQILKITRVTANYFGRRFNVAMLFGSNPGLVAYANLSWTGKWEVFGSEIPDLPNLSHVTLEKIQAWSGEIAITNSWTKLKTSTCDVCAREFEGDFRCPDCSILLTYECDVCGREFDTPNACNICDDCGGCK